tara:strand:+ start:1041 stop:1844 length:804 start_codon:yes stop_codon:yes gene_type:complete
MLNLKRLATLFCLFVLTQSMHSQFGFSPEIGIIAGPVQFRSDYGSREDSETNLGNSGFGIGIVSYLNFSYDRGFDYTSRDTYFKDHFKVRSEISWNKTKLEHFGRWVDPSKTTENSKRLRGQKGVAKNVDLGLQLEFYPFSIKDFEYFVPRLSPFVSLGLHYTFFSSEVSTTYANPDPSAIGDVLDASNFYSLWDPGSVDARSGNTLSLVSSVGVRYKLNKMNDLMLDLRGQYYFSDWVDGLNHQLPFNKNNDWLLWLNVGYIFYFN